MSQVPLRIERGPGMTWLGTATSLGFVVGPALGGFAVREADAWKKHA